MVLDAVFISSDFRFLLQFQQAGQVDKAVGIVEEGGVGEGCGGFVENSVAFVSVTEKMITGADFEHSAAQGSISPMYAC